MHFYLDGKEYPAVVTLAGAAEEVLGKMANANGLEPSLKRTVRELLETYKAVWGHEAKEGDFADLRNRVRNELKHFCSGKDVEADYEHEAGSMLTRALENFLLCTGSRHPRHYAFTSKRVANWCAKQKLKFTSKES